MQSFCAVNHFYLRDLDHSKTLKLPENLMFVPQLSKKTANRSPICMKKSFNTGWLMETIKG
jgi:hypothetical protein